MIRFTVFSKDRGYLTKVLRLLPTGEVHKDASHCGMASGRFNTLNVSGVREFGNVLARCKTTQCLGYGTCVVKPEGRIVAQDKAKNGDITRTKNNFAYLKGQSAILMLDYDGPEGEPSLSKNEWMDILYEVCPALAKTANAWRASTSSYITKDGAELRGLTGQHLYVAVGDGSDIPRAGEVLAKRLWLAGHGYIFISKAGAMLPRTVIDAAVFSPERLDFVAGAMCNDGLRQGDLTPVYADGEELLDTREALPDLTPEQEEEYSRLVETAKGDKHSEAMVVRGIYIDERGEDIAVSRCIHKDEARRIVEAAVREKANLYGDFPLKFDKAGWVSVEEALKNHGRFDRMTLADPLEPDYNGGQNIARFYANNGAKPVIHSFAHGDKTYFLRPGKPGGAETEGNGGIPEEPSESFWYAPPDAAPPMPKVYGKKAYPYVVVDGCIHYLKRTKESEVEVPLCNFDSRITQEVIHDDGADVKSLFLIEGMLASGRRLAAIEVTTSSFAGLSWVTSYWGNAPVIYAGNSIKDHLRCAVQRLSGIVPRNMVYGHYGWRKLDDQWRYLHAEGALGADGNRTDIEVAADKGAMRSYCLPAPPEDSSLAKKTVRESLKLRGIAKNKGCGYALLSTTYRAPLGEAYRIDLTLYLSGYTGMLKSEVTAIALAHFGQEFTGRNFPASFEDTETDLEIKAFHAKDAIFVVDDFKPKGGDGDINRLHAKADRLFRGAGNQSGRGRRTATLQSRPAYYPRGFILSSGEDIPRGQSLRARLCIVEVKPGDVDVGELTNLQQAASKGLLAQAMAGYIRWLAPQMDDLKKTLPDKICAHRKDSGRYAHSRFIDNHANLVTGLEMFLMYAEDIGAVTETEGKAVLAEGTAALDSLMHDQVAYQTDADETARFSSLLVSALFSGRCHMIDFESQGEPKDSRDYGWQRCSSVDGAIWKPMGACIGWVDAEKLYLEPETTFTVVQQFASDQKEPFPVTQGTFWRRLADKGLLVDRDLGDGKNRNSSKKWIAGKSRRVAIILKPSPESGKERATK